MITVNVSLGERSYPILIGRGAILELRGLCDRMFGSQPIVVVIADETVAALHGARFESQTVISKEFMTFPSGEASKTLAMAESIYERLAAARIERGAVILSLGGGVAGDLAGFVAGTWMRGVAFIQVPTTLLAAIDASVGGKTGVNLPTGKNLVGVFHQPIAVIIDPDFLETLPNREYVAGLAESVKHAIIRDAPFFDWHERHADAIAGREPDIVAELIARNCAIKAAVVSADERELGIRAILNYGHTIGHALEHRLDYELRHGECIALGMRVAVEIATRRRLLSADEARRVGALLTRFGLPEFVPRPLAAGALLETCQLDKKVRGGAMQFVLAGPLGTAHRVADVTAAEIEAALRCIGIE